MLAIVLSLGGLNALAPVIIIIILIAAAAGLTRGADIFAIFGIGSLLGITSGIGGGGVGRGMGRGAARFGTQRQQAMRAATPFGKAAGAGAAAMASKALGRNIGNMALRSSSARAATLAILAAQQKKGQVQPQKGGLVKFATRFGLAPRPGAKRVTAEIMKGYKNKRAQINKEFRAGTGKEIRKSRESLREMAPKTLFGSVFGGMSRYVTRTRERQQIELLTKRAELTAQHWLNIVQEKDRPELVKMHQRYKDARDGVYVEDPATHTMQQAKRGFFDYQKQRETAMVNIDEGRAGLKRVQRQLSDASGDVKELSARMAKATARGATTAAISALQDRLSDAKARADALQNDVDSRRKELTKWSQEYRLADRMERRMQDIMDRASLAMEEFVVTHHATPQGTIATFGNMYNPASWYKLATINALNGRLHDPALTDPKNVVEQKYDLRMNELFQKVYKEHGYEAATEAVDQQWLHKQIKSMSEGGIDKPRGMARMEEAIRLNYVNKYYEDMIGRAKLPGPHSGLAAFLSDISRKELERREEEMLAAHRARGVMEQRTNVYAPSIIQQYIDMRGRFERYVKGKRPTP